MIQRITIHFFASSARILIFCCKIETANSIPKDTVVITISTQFNPKVKTAPFHNISGFQEENITRYMLQPSVKLLDLKNKKPPQTSKKVLILCTKTRYLFSFFIENLTLNLFQKGFVISPITIYIQ